MAGALSYADVLSDEFTYLHGKPPRVAATVKAKHLRELPRLIQRLKALGDSAGQVVSQDALLARYCDFSCTRDDTRREYAAVKRAFGILIRSEEVEFAGRTSSLFEALVRIHDRNKVATARLRTPEILRKLVGIRHARRFIFRDETAANVVGSTPELREAIAIDSSAIRLLDRMPGGREVLVAYPPLLATIADEPALDEWLTYDEDLRAELVRLFAEQDQPSAIGRVWQTIVGKRDARVRPELWTVASDPYALAKALTEKAKEAVDDDCLPRVGPVPDVELTNFNAILLETAFPDHFTDSYDVRALNTAMHQKNMAALCLSGGGIRSATFNLGILQGLADHGLLTRFHYLSTVSGGGYIGSWLSSWIRRHNDGVWGVAKDISAPPADPEEPEVQPIEHLREYSSYLAPRSASLSTDTWTLVATYFRNLLLNWTMLLPALAAVMVLPRLFESAAYQAGSASEMWAGRVAVALGAIAIFGITFLRPKNEQQGGRAPSEEEIRRKYHQATLWVYPLVGSAVAFCLYWAARTRPPRWWELPLIFMSASTLAGIAYVVSHLYSLAACGSVWQRIRNAWQLLKNRKTALVSGGEILASAATGLVAGLLLHVSFVNAFQQDVLRKSDATLYFEQFVCLGIPLFMVTFFAGVTLLVGFTTRRTNDHDREWWARCAALMLLAGLIWMIGATVAVVLPLLFAQLPEILASAGGVSGAVAWLLSKSAKLRSKSERESTAGAAVQLGLHAAATIAVAVILAALSFATTLILARLFVTDSVAVKAIGEWKLTKSAALHLQVLHQTPWSYVFLFGTAAAVIAAVMSVLLKVNVYSMHSMYRNRLIRAYLGASRWYRRPDPFTGFDPQDNVEMFELRADALWTSSYNDFDGFVKELASGGPACRDVFGQLDTEMQQQIRVYLNTPPRERPKDVVRSAVTHALNKLMATHDIRHGVAAPASTGLFGANRRYLEDLFPQLVKSVHTPDPGRPPVEAPPVDAEEGVVVPVDGEKGQEPHCRRPPLHILNTTLNLVRGEKLAWQERKADSFTISPLHAGNRRLGYRDSYEYGEQITLGTAMAISGAALSPNMGFQSSPPLTFLMTLFNARLGWWLGNPSRGTYNQPGPTSTLQSLLAELSGNTNDTSDYVFLSDGGHFDNLGLYEMVRRRCRFIVVSDATADGKYAFSDLGNAVRKIRIDMGIPITLRTTYLPPGPDEKAGRYCAVGRIDYGTVDTVCENRRMGYLLYIKPAVYTDCPPDVRNYQKESDAFPHETTIDQFFCESQFESYRALGRHVIGRICRDKPDKPPNRARDVEEFVGWAAAYMVQTEPPPVEVVVVDR